MSMRWWKEGGRKSELVVSSYREKVGADGVLYAALCVRCTVKWVESLPHGNRFTGSSTASAAVP